MAMGPVGQVGLGVFQLLLGSIARHLVEQAIGMTDRNIMVQVVQEMMGLIPPQHQGEV
jgi:hypothetical protein